MKSCKKRGQVEIVLEFGARNSGLLFGTDE